MPRYFFNLSDGKSEYDDHEGAALADDAAAKDMARQVASDLAKDGAYDGFWVVVRDDLQNELCRVPVTKRH